MSTPDPGVAIKAVLEYPPDFRPVGISWSNLSRINADVQLDLGYTNIHDVVSLLNERSGEEPVSEVRVQVAFSAYLTLNGFVKLHRDVTQFYELLRRDGIISDVSAAEGEQDA